MSPLSLTPPHGKVDLLESLLANTHAALRHLKAAAEQIKSTDRWAVLLRYISDKIAPVVGPFRLPQALPGTGCLPDLGLSISVMVMVMVMVAGGQSAAHHR